MNEIDAIFDALNKASRCAHLMDARAKKLSQLRNAKSKRCGNCFHWMKSSCVPEKKHKQFKSCDSPGCMDFQLTNLFLIEKFEKELAEIDAKILPAAEGEP